MSHPSHIEHLREARVAGYATRLIYVATDDPRISIGRVAQRVAEGGHDVPLNRIVDRYSKSIGLLPYALSIGTGARLYDNSSREEPFRLVARSTGGLLQFELPTAEWPRWVRRLTSLIDL